MNERIKQFFSEATFEPDRLVDGIYYPYIPLQCSGEPWRHTITDDGIQKFAELIIEECGVALHPMMRDMISRGQAHQLIKEHFGIEE
jgi:hypothetical protein